VAILKDGKRLGRRRKKMKRRFNIMKKKKKEKRMVKKRRRRRKGTLTKNYKHFLVRPSEFEA